MFIKFQEQEEDDDLKHPSCAHGPTHLFWKTQKHLDGYFACSAFRDFKDCPFKVEFIKDKSDYRCDSTSTVKDKEECRLVEPHQPIGNDYCYTCNVIIPKTIGKTHGDHIIHKNLSAQDVEDPTDFLLKPVGKDKAEAQYFFDNATMENLGQIIKEQKCSKVICIGTPRIHFYAKNQMLLKSFLLDLDERFLNFCSQSEFALFNMCNFHFLDSSQEFKEFLKGEMPLIILDPPFACRTEPICNTLKQITNLYCTLNKVHRILPIFWIFPYYFENYIRRFMPEMEMCDFKINYTNHKLFSSHDGGRKYGSPIRFFTNVPLASINLKTIGDGYTHCSLCKKWVSKENRHCRLCRICPSKNGQTYRHCEFCGLCVKPNYVHCSDCRRCTQKEGHICREYQKTLRCWICRRVGHNEWNCTRKCKKNKTPIKCFICSKKGHNEMHCRKRGAILNERVFMSEHTLFK